MAPVELADLSSNWKKLQKTLQPAAPKAETKQQNSRKRKKSSTPDGEDKPRSSKPIAGTGKQGPRKRQRMEEPASVGFSVKRRDAKALSRSLSMPSLKQPSLLSDPREASKSISVLAPSPDHPDVENEGISSTALPGKYIALDCEMVGTGPEPDRDSALARVSVVNYHGHQIYDSYVQVKVDVTDYRSAVSGIEPRHIRKDVARPFSEVHKDMAILLGNRILVGHGVKNDLDMLQLKHDKRFIRDTSKFSRFRELAPIPGRTPSLKGLVEKLLGVEIQTGAHNSVEDARATMALFRLEKEEFEKEITKMYGQVKILPNDTGDGAEGEAARRKKNRKKKKKKKNRG